MKKLVLLTVTVLALFACKKEPLIISEPTADTGTLKFQIKCDGVAMDAAEIEIKAELGVNNWITLHGWTDPDGKVEFPHLTPSTYFWRIKYPNKTEFIDMKLGGIEVTANGQHGVPVFINGNCQ